MAQTKYNKMIKSNITGKMESVGVARLSEAAAKVLNKSKAHTGVTYELVSEKEEATVKIATKK